MNSTNRICLWSGPRNISTALMYSFGNRPDTAIVDEPFYGYYLKNSRAKDYHPSAEEIMASMECDGSRIVEQLLSFHAKPIYFIKNMPHHIQGLPLEFLDQMEHVILVRKPRAMVRSFVKVIAKPQLKDFGYQEQLALLETLKSKGLNYHLLDSAEVLENPEKRLRKVCGAVNIPFSDKMLKWPQGARKEDGIWAKHWYKNVHQSTSFKKQTKVKEGKIADNLMPLVKELEVFYENIMIF